jgi:hypothetical protein
MDRFDTLATIEAITNHPRINGLRFGHKVGSERKIVRIIAWCDNGPVGGQWIVGEAPTLEGAWQAFLRLVPEDVLGGAPASPTIHQKPAVTVPDFGALMKRG